MRRGRDGGRHDGRANACSLGRERADTPRGQMAFFAELIDTAGVSDHWVDAFPLHSHNQDL